MLLLLAPVLFELAVRLDDLARYGVPLASGAASVADLHVRDSVGDHARPGAVFKKFRVNSMGFRGPDVSKQELSSHRLVVTAGSSESFGLYEAPNKEWPRQLADTLSRRCSSSPITVLNSAFAGMSLPTVTQDLRRRILPLKPAVVVYYPQPTQYLYQELPRASEGSLQPIVALSPWNLRGRERLRNDLKGMLSPAMLEFFRGVDKARSQRSGQTPFERLPVERLDSMEVQLRELVGAIRQGDAIPVLVQPQNRFDDTTVVAERRWLRGWERLLPKASGEMLLEFSRLGAERVRLVASDSSVLLTGPDFPSGSWRAPMFADPVHFSDEGAALMAGAVGASVASTLGCRP